MNSVITDMYTKKAVKSGVGSDNLCEKTHSVMPTSSGINFTIDRTGAQSPRTVFESDRQKSNVDSSDSITVCDAGTCQQSTTDDIIVIEDNHDKNVMESTTTPVSSATVSVDEQCSTEEKTVIHSHFILIIPQPVEISTWAITNMPQFQKQNCYSMCWYWRQWVDERLGNPLPK